MTVGELLELSQEFEDMDPETEIRIASQPHWPFEYSIMPEVHIAERNVKQDEDEGEGEGEGEDDGKETVTVIYLAEHKQIDYLNDDTREFFNARGWKL